jgi:hypothetical protein
LEAGSKSSAIRLCIPKAFWCGEQFGEKLFAAAKWTRLGFFATYVSIQDTRTLDRINNMQYTEAAIERGFIHEH